MGSKLVEFQVRIRNAADTADALTLTSIRGGTSPDIAEAPTGEGATLDPFTGKITSGSITVNVADRITSGTSRVFTSALEDANFRQQLGQRKTFVEFREDGGAWQTLYAGRIANYRLVSDAVWAITVSDWMKAEHEFQVFDFHEGDDVEAYLDRWPNRGAIIGGPILGGFREIVDRGGWRFRCVVDGTSFGKPYTRLDFVSGYFPNGADTSEITPELLRHVNDAAESVGSSRIPNIIKVATGAPNGVVVEVDAGFRSFPELLVFVDNQAQPKLAIGGPGSNVDPISTGFLISMEGAQRSVGSLYLNGSAASNGVSVGQVYRINIITRRVTEASPIFWTGHPTELLSKLWDEADLPYVASSLTTVTETLGANLRLSLMIDRAWNLGEILEQAVYGPFGIGARGAEASADAGNIEAFVSRIFANSPPPTTITDADVIQTETEAFDLDASTGMKMLVVEHTRLTDNRNASWTTMVGTQVERFESINDDPDAIKTGVVEFRIPGMIHVLDNPEMDLRGWVDGRAIEIAERRGRGRRRMKTVLLRGGAGDGVKLGDEILVNLKQLPNKNKRLGDDPTVGARAMQVLHVTPALRGKLVELEDSGQHAQTTLTDLPTHTIAASSTNPRTVALATITNAATLNAALYGARIQMAVTTGAAPATTDYTEVQFFKYGSIPTTAFGLPAVKAGRTVYIRARTESKTARPSNWSVGVGITLSAITAPSAVAATAVAGNGSSLDLTWTVGAIDCWTNIFVRASGDPAADAVKHITLPAGSDRYRLDGLAANTTYTVGVQHVDPLTGDVSAITEDTETTANAALTLSAPTNAVGFSSVVGEHRPRNPFRPSGNATTLGRYGIAVRATEFPGFVEVEEAIETAVGSGTYGSFAVVGRVESIAGDWTRWDGVAANEGLRRQLRARHVRDGYTSSAYTGTVTVSPWTLVAIPTDIDFFAWGTGDPVKPRREVVWNDGDYAVRAVDSAGEGMRNTVGVSEGSAIHKIFRHREEITVNGPDADGDVAVTFGATYQNAPAITFRGGQYNSFSNTLGTSAKQKLRIQAINITASGFTSRAQILSAGSTTPQTDDFASGNLCDAAGETAEVNLDPGGANDDTYNVQFRVSITVDEHPTNFNTATLEVAIDTNDGSGWVERATFSYATSNLSGPPPFEANSGTWNAESKAVVVTGLGLNDDIRIRAKSFSVNNGGTGSFELRGADAGGANPDTRNGVTYNTASDTIESAIPDAGDSVGWVAQEVV